MYLLVFFVIVKNITTKAVKIVSLIAKFRFFFCLDQIWRFTFINTSDLYVIACILCNWYVFARIASNTNNKNICEMPKGLTTDNVETFVANVCTAFCSGRWQIVISCYFLHSWFAELHCWFAVLSICANLTKNATNSREKQIQS